MKRKRKFGEFTPRRDGVEKSETGRRIWEGRKYKGLHPSHCKVGKDIVKSQNVPGYCFLCPKQMFFFFTSQVERHFSKVHCKKKIIIEDIILLQCKCSDVCNQGLEGCVRNIHYHCNECHRPKLHISQLIEHLVKIHGYDPEELNKYMPKPRKLKIHPKGKK